MVQIDGNDLDIGVAHLQAADDNTGNTAKAIDSYLDFFTH